jgi:hypothetical protein
MLSIFTPSIRNRLTRPACWRPNESFQEIGWWKEKVLPAAERLFCLAHCSISIPNHWSHEIDNFFALVTWQVCRGTQKIRMLLAHHPELLRISVRLEQDHGGQSAGGLGKFGSAYTAPSSFRSVQFLAHQPCHLSNGRDECSWMAMRDAGIRFNNQQLMFVTPRASSNHVSWSATISAATFSFSSERGKHSSEA